MRARLVFAFVMASFIALTPVARAQDAPPDSVKDLFRQLSDSTDASYGQESVEFDTTGFDTLRAFDFGDMPEPRPDRRGGALSFSPVFSYHRTTGVVLGGGATVSSLPLGALHAEGSMGLENQGGRYQFLWRKPLWYGRKDLSTRRLLAEPSLLDRRRQLDLVLEYARTTENFTPEHARPIATSARAILFGRDEQSVYEARGFRGALNLWHGDWRVTAGYADMKERAMPLESRWSVFGNRDSVPDNLPATLDEYQEPFGGVAFWRSDWETGMRIDARGGGEDRWRVRGALGKAVRIGSGVKAYVQAEYGATAAGSPLQRMFSVGGPRLLRTVRTGETMANHMMGGKIDFVSSADVLRSIGLGGPDWLILNPWVITEAAVVWDDSRSVVFSNPPGRLWRGSAGGGFVFRPGIPDANAWLRIGYIARVGRQPGQSHFTVSFDRAFDLLGKL